MLPFKIAQIPTPTQPITKPKPMKKTILNQCLLPALAALALVASTSQTQAQFPQGDYVNNFDTSTSTSGHFRAAVAWHPGYIGTVRPAITWQ